MQSSNYDICIVGAGISGLSAATFLLDRQPECKLLVLEQSSQAGGAIATHNAAGYLAEWGPHGFLDNCAESRHLIALAELEQERITVPLGTFVRYICLEGRLRCIPQQPLKIIREPLISWPAKARVLADLWQRPLAGKPTVAQWVAHRFGAALLPFADAVFTGTYAGDIERLRIDAVMPGVRDLEQQHGSVIRGLVHRMRAARANKQEAQQVHKPQASRKSKQAKKQLPAMTSFSGGMAMLPERLAAQLAAREAISFSNFVQAVDPLSEGWRIQSERGAMTCRHLILALPINQGLALLGGLQSVAPPPLAVVPEARILSVLLGFDQRAQIPFGFGYLAPEREQRFALGALFSSHMFPGRAPAGQQLVEVLVGGRRHPERLEMNDAALIEAVCADLGQLMTLPPPSFTAVLRPRAGIPQLEAGYTDLLAWRERVQATSPGLHLCGFGWQGIGINDMIKGASQIAERICTATNRGAVAELKGVYF
jgi:oxygen-dependent protoporphyrinogen oxidase